MKKLIFSLLFLCSLRLLGQNCSSWEDRELELLHPDTCIDLLSHNGQGLGTLINFAREEWQTFPFRTTFFNAYFHPNAAYETTDPGNQWDWNKVMYISTFEYDGFVLDYAIDGGVWSLRLGWRWNPISQLMELGLYSHIRHTLGNPIPGSNNGREAIFLTSVPLETNVPCELVFSEEGMYARAGNVGYAIKRKFNMKMYGILNLLSDQVKTGLKREAYFGGQECPPHTINIDVSNIVTDCEPIFWGNAPIKGFGRSFFYPGESLSYFADEEIRAPVMVEGPAAGFQEYSGQFVKIHGGANINFSACNRVVLEPGFETMPGATFTAQVTNCRVAGNNSSQSGGNNQITYSEPVLNERQNENNGGNEVYFFPNPCNRNLTGLFPENFTEGTITLRDISGKLVLEENIFSNFQEFNLPNLSPGSYVAIATPKDPTLNSVFKKITVLQQ